MKKFLVIIEPTSKGYSAFCPDLPGCVATAKSRAGLVRSMRSAIKFHLEGMKAEGIRIPKPRTSSTYLEIKAA